MGYKFYDFKSNRALLARDAVFFEKESYCNEKEKMPEPKEKAVICVKDGWNNPVLSAPAPIKEVVNQLPILQKENKLAKVPIKEKHPSTNKCNN